MTPPNAGAPATTASPDASIIPLRDGVRGIIDPATFWHETRQNVKPMQAQSIPSGLFGERMIFRVPNTGIITRLRLHFDLVITVADSGTHTALAKFPWGLIKHLTVRANGSEIVKSVSGMQLRALMQVMYGKPDVSAVESLTVTSGSDAAYPVDFVLDVPLAFDQGAVISGLFAESDENYFEVEINFESQSEIVTLSSATWAAAGTVHPHLVTCDVIHANTSQGRAVILPDVRSVQMLNSKRHFITAAGENRATLSPTTGTLMRMLVGQYDASAKDWVDPLTWSRFALQYGGNQKLREYAPVRDLVWENALNYDGKIEPDYVVLDNMAENFQRDGFVPGPMLEGEVIIDSTGLTVAGGDYIEVLEQVNVPDDQYAPRAA